MSEPRVIMKDQLTIAMLYVLSEVSPGSTVQKAVQLADALWNKFGAETITPDKIEIKTPSRPQIKNDITEKAEQRQEPQTAGGSPPVVSDKDAILKVIVREWIEGRHLAFGALAAKLGHSNPSKLDPVIDELVSEGKCRKIPKGRGFYIIPTGRSPVEGVEITKCGPRSSGVPRNVNLDVWNRL